MRIVAAALAPLRCRLRAPLVTARGAVAERGGFVLRLTGDSGEVGAGEGSPIHWLGEGSLAATAAELERVVAAVIDERPSDEELRARFLIPTGAESLSGAAACALDAALLEVAARAARVGVGALLGGVGPMVLPVAALVGGATEDALLAAVDAALAAGFTTIKMKVGAGALAADVRRVDAVRARVGADVRLRLDANRAWTVDGARAALRAFAAADPEFVEEPLADGDPAALAALARATPVPLALDESIVDASDLDRAVASGARVHVVLKAVRVGGPTRLLALARRAHAAGLPVVVTDGIESAVGMRVALHAAAALAGAIHAVGLGGAQLLADHEAEALRRPYLAVRGPGYAVEVPAPASAAVAHG